MGNPGPVGWAALVIKGDVIPQNIQVLYGTEFQGSSNRAELVAALLSLTHTSDGDVTLYTDSHYVIHRVVRYLDPKRRHGVRGKNVEIWNVFDEWLKNRRLLNVGRISFEQIKGHNGDPYNNWADAIARQVVRMTLKNRIDLNEPWNETIASSIIERSSRTIERIKSKAKRQVNPIALEIFSVLLEKAIARQSLYELRLFSSAAYLTL